MTTHRSPQRQPTSKLPPRGKASDPPEVRRLKDEARAEALKRIHPLCKVCGFAKGGLDSWDGKACKCGHSEPPITLVP